MSWHNLSIPYTLSLLSSNVRARTARGSKGFMSPSHHRSWWYDCKGTGKALSKNCMQPFDEEACAPIVCVLRSEMFPWEFLLDYYSVRYHLLLEKNENVEKCRENDYLREIDDAFRRNYKPEKVVGKCLDLFWPYVRQDSERKGAQRNLRPHWSDRYMQKEAVRMQLKTTKSNDLQNVSHDKVIRFPLSSVTPNPHSNAPLIRRAELDIIDAITPMLLKARYCEELHCLKFAKGSSSLLREASCLYKMPQHPSLPRLTGFVDAGNGNIEALVVPFISGKMLFSIGSCTLAQKTKWK